MSTVKINNEISRITNAKNAIREAAQGKGVTIPEDARLFDYPEYLSQIPSSAIQEPHVLYKSYLANLSAFQHVSIYNTASIPDSFFIRQQRTPRFTIGEGVLKIGAAAFYTNTATTTIDLPSTLNSIQANAFYGCTALDNVFLPSKSISIASNAFNECTGIKTFDIIQNFNSNLPLPTCNALTQESVSNIITHYKEGSGKTFTVAASVYANIPQSELTRAANKGLTIASA